MSKETKKRNSQIKESTDLKYSVGIDISKVTFDACISVINIEQEVKTMATRSKILNNEKGFADLLGWVISKCKKNISIVFTMEATGIYYEKLAWFLHRKNLNVSVVLPLKSKKYMQGKGIKTKNDKIDAKGLSCMGAEQRLEKWNAPNESIVLLRGVTRQRQNLQETRTIFNNQLKAHISGEFVNENVTKQLEEIISLLDRQIAETEAIVKDQINKDKYLKERTDKILQIKGLGLITIATVIAETGGFAMFKNQRQLTSYAGYDVIENQSGNHVGRTKISKKGNSHIRRIMHLPAFCVINSNEPMFKALFERVYERTKIKMKGYVAVQRKLLMIIYTLWKKDEEYIANYQNDKCVK